MTNAIEIIEDRRAGKTCRQIAEERGIPEHAIWNLMRKTGNAGRFRGEPKAYARRDGSHATQNLRTEDLILLALGQADDMTIERGIDGGFIVSIGDEAGTVQCDIQSAIRAAMGRRFANRRHDDEGPCR